MTIYDFKQYTAQTFSYSTMTRIDKIKVKKEEEERIKQEEYNESIEE